jgi:hypothetical protein
MDASPSIGDFWKILLLRTATIESIGNRRPASGLAFACSSLRLIASMGLLAGGLPRPGRRHSRLGCQRRRRRWRPSPRMAADLTPRLASAMNAAADRLQGA